MSPPKLTNDPSTKDSLTATEPLNNGTSIQDIFAALSEAYCKHREEGRRRAELAFQAYCDTEFSLEAASGQSYSDVMDAHWQKAERRRLIINSNLDADSILDFVEIVIKDHTRAVQATRAHKRHAEHRAFKQTVFAWCDSNMAQYKSMDKAAEAIAGKGKLVAVAFRTARGWIKEWKDLQSAGKP